MLYRDPTGKSVGATPSTSTPRFIANQSINSNAESDEKITMLEKALMEKDNRISELTHRIKALKVGIF